MVDAETKNTSTVVVALPSRDDHVHDFGPEQKHATILWLGEIEDDAAVQAKVAEVARDLKPFSVKVTEMSELGEDDPRAVVLKLGSTEGHAHGLRDLHTELKTDAAVNELWSSIKQYPNYTPHVTLGYGDEVSDDDRDDAPQLESITFDRLAVWHKDDQTEYPLGPEKVEGLVAGSRIVRTQEGSKRFGVPIGSEIQTDDDGNVVKARTSSPGASAPRTRATASEPVDPDRTPTKFVPTVPGQKAKLVAPPGGVAGASSNGLNSEQTDAVTDFDLANKYAALTPASRAAMQALTNGKPLTAADRAALCAMIVKILSEMNKPKESDDKKSEGSGERTAAQKEATAKAQEASSESTSDSKKAAQKKSQSAATKASALKRTLEAAYKALGGDPKGLPADDSGSAEKSSSESSGASKSDSSAAPAKKSASSGDTESNPSTAVPSGAYKSTEQAKEPPLRGFSAMNGKELHSALRSLVSARKADPNNPALKSAIARARKVRDRRAEIEAKRQAERDKFMDRVTT